MSPSVTRGLLNLRKLRIESCVSMEEVITKEEQQGEGIMTLFPLLEYLELSYLPKLEHFFLTECTLEFPSLREVNINYCPEMKTFVQQGISVSLGSVNNDEAVKVVNLNKAMFNSKVSCPNLEELYISGADSISDLCSHQLPTAYFSKLEILRVKSCGKLRNLMSPSVARDAPNLRILKIDGCDSLEEVITKEEQQGEGIMTNEPLFPLLNKLELFHLPKLGHFFLTEHALKFPFLREVRIDDCPKMKTFVQQGISVSTPSLESVNNDDDVKVVDLNKAMFNSKVSCPNLEELCIYGVNSISSLCSHQLPTSYFSKLKTLEVKCCGNLRNLMSPSVARGLLNLRKLEIYACDSLEEVITKEEQQGEGIITLFPLLKELYLLRLPKLGRFFLTECTFEIPYFKEKIDDLNEWIRQSEWIRQNE